MTVDGRPEPGWWQASDGNWYPPETHPDRAQPPAPGWWVASDGNWYPPRQQTPPPAAPPAAPVPSDRPRVPPSEQLSSPPLTPASQALQNAPTPSGPRPPVLIGAVLVALLLAGVGVFLLLRSSDEDTGVAAGVADSARPTTETPTVDADESAPAPAATSSAPGDGSSGTAGASTSSDRSCVYLGPDSFDDVHAELRFTMPFDAARDLDVAFALVDGSGQRFLTSSAFVEAAQPGERFRLDADTLESLPASIVDDSAVTCEILAIEDFPFSEEPEVVGEAACEVTGVDSFGDVQVDLAVTNPTDMAADLSIVYALRGDGVRFQTGFTFIERVGAGEAIRSPEDSFTDAPDWARDLTCAVIDLTVFDS